MSRYIRITTLFAILTLIAAACGDDDDAGTEVVSLAAGSSADVYIPQYRANEQFGDLFDLSTADGVTLFEDGALAAQVAIAGRTDIASGGFAPVVQVIESGVEAKAFCPVQIDSTEHLVGRTDVITSLDQITDPNVRVAVESAGGFLNLLMNLVFDNLNMGITTDDLTNTIILEDGSLRLAALASGDVDVGSLDLFEQAELAAELGPGFVTVLSVVAEDADFLANMLWAPTDWLDDNIDLAARFCASLIYSNRIVSSDFDRYRTMMDQYVEGGVDADVLRINWDFIREHEVFPLNPQVLSAENVNTLLRISVATGIFEPESAALTYEEVVSVEVLDKALEYLGGAITREQMLAGQIPEPDCC